MWSLVIIFGFFKFENSDLPIRQGNFKQTTQKNRQNEYSR